HPTIVTAYDAGRVGGTYYLAMDFVDGADLSALVGRVGPLGVPDACELVRQAAVGLQHACECGLAHRDVKPSNLMLARGGVVKVLDLGLARSLADLPAEERLTTSGMVLGTADYVAPEQIDRAHTAAARAATPGEVAAALAPFAARADPAGLLTRVDGAAPTLREAVPTTRPAAGRRRRGPGRAAVRYALAAAAGALVALLAVAPFLG